MRYTHTKTSSPPNSKRARIALVATIVITLLVAVWVGIYAWGNSAYHSPDVPHPLGDKLTYIGKSDYGCERGFCDSKPGSTYFYATDMNPEEIVKYFKKATIYSPAAEESESTRIWLNSAVQSRDFVLSYYVDGEKSASKFSLPNVGKRHVIELDRESYLTAKNFL